MKAEPLTEEELTAIRREMEEQPLSYTACERRLLATVSAERQRCLDCCAAHSRDDGTAQRIAADIRRGK